MRNRYIVLSDSPCFYFKSTWYGTEMFWRIRLLEHIHSDLIPRDMLTAILKYYFNRHLMCGMHKGYGIMQVGYANRITTFRTSFTRLWILTCSFRLTSWLLPDYVNGYVNRDQMPGWARCGFLVWFRASFAWFLMFPFTVLPTVSVSCMYLPMQRTRERTIRSRRPPPPAQEDIDTYLLDCMVRCLDTSQPLPFACSAGRLSLPSRLDGHE